MYNGYKNYQTWNVALWISNDEGLYNIAKGFNKYRHFRDEMMNDGIEQTPDGIFYNDTGLDFERLDELIREL